MSVKQYIFLKAQENDEASADKYSEVALQADKYNPSGMCWEWLVAMVV